MPTLTTRIAAASKITTAAAVTTPTSSSSSLLPPTSQSLSASGGITMATHGANNSFDTTAGAATTPSLNSSNAAASEATCTFSTNNDYRQRFQQQQQQQQPQQKSQKQQLPLPPLPTQPQPLLNHHQHYYSYNQQQHQQQQKFNHSNSPPPLPPPHPPHLDETGSAAGSTVAGSCSVTFNGNAAAAVVGSGGGGGAVSNTATASNQIVSNGNISNVAGVVTHSNGNGNIMSSTFALTSISSSTSSPAATTFTNAFNATVAANQQQQTNNKLETSSLAGSNSLNGSIKKSSSHASREDVASLGGGSSINSQSAALHNNSNSINNNSNNNNIHNSSSFNNNITKDNPLQNYYNGLAGSTHNPDNDDDDGLGPLPPKWETAYTERGELYFIDHNTGTSHWLDPRLSKFQKKSLEDCSDNELPYGWEKIEDSLYGTYYIDHVNRRTQYENPVLEAKRRAAEQRKQQKLPPPPQPLQHDTSNESEGDGGAGSGSQTGSSSGCTDSITMNGCVEQNQQQQKQRGPPPSPATGVGEKPPPPLPLALLPYKFTRNPSEMQGERITTTLVKSARGLGITIVGGDDSVEEFLQIKSIVPNGPAWLDGQLQMGDILVYVNDTCVLGFSHHEMVNVFQSILPGETVTLEICRGYPLPFDPNDPNTEVVTTIAVDGITTEPDKQRRLLMDLNMDGNYNFLDVSDSTTGNTLHDATLKNGPHAAESPGDFMLMKKPEILTFSIFKGVMGFGFTIADSAYGQKVKKILDRNCCKQLQEGDILLEINSVSVRNKSHIEVVQVLKDCSKTSPTTVKIQRSGANFNAAAHSGGNVTKLRKNFISNSNGLFRSKTPTADLYSTQQKEILPIRPKTPLVDTRARARAQTPNNELNDAEVAAATNGIDVVGGGVGLDKGRSLTTLAANSSKSPQLDAKSTNSLQELDVMPQDIPFMDPYPKLVTSLSERLAEATLMNDGGMGTGMSRAHGGAAGYHVNNVMHSNNNHNSNINNYENQEYVPSVSNHLGSGSSGGYNPIYGMSPMVASNISTLNHPVHHMNNGAQSSSGALYAPAMHLMPSTNTTTAPAPTYHHESCYCYECQDYQRYKYRQQQQQQQQQQQHHQLPPLQTNYYTLPHQPPQTQQQQQQQHTLNHHHQPSQYSPAMQPTPLQAAHIQNERMQKRVNELLNDRRKVGFSPLEIHHSNSNTTGYLHPSLQQQQQHQPQQHSPATLSLPQQQGHNNWSYNTLQPVLGGGMHVNGVANMNPAMRQCLDEDDHQYELTEVTLERQALGFGFRIVGGTEEGSQVTVGHIVPGGAADNDHRIATGDEILSIDGINVVNSSHHKVVSLMGEAALRGQVNMILRRRTLRPHLMPTMSASLRLPVIRYPYDVIVNRHENEGFGFVIISSANQYYGSTIGKLIPGSPADRCGELKVGDRIIAVNRLEIAGMSHGDVVQLIKESGLHVRLTIGCPKDGNPMLSTSAQASPGSQLSQTQQSSLSSTASVAATTSLLQPSNLTQQQTHLNTTQQQQPNNQSLQQQQQQLPKSETPTYFERNSQITSQHPQL